MNRKSNREPTASEKIQKAQRMAQRLTAETPAQDVQQGEKAHAAEGEARMSYGEKAYKETQWPVRAVSIVHQREGRLERAQVLDMTNAIVFETGSILGAEVDDLAELLNFMNQIIVGLVQRINHMQNAAETQEQVLAEERSKRRALVRDKRHVGRRR